MDYSPYSQDILRDGEHLFYTDGRGGLYSYEGPGGVVRVPEGVDCIAPEAFALCTHVTSVILPEGVWNICRRAFYRSGIRTVSLPESLKEIGEFAFAGTPLEHVRIPDQVKTIEKQAFRDAAHLEFVRLPEGLISLEPEVFSGCVSLKEALLPESLKYIQGGAFSSCSSLEHITLPESLVAVWTKAFSGCTSLREISLGDSVETIGDDAFTNCTALETIRIPEGLKMPCGDAFRNCSRIVLTGPGGKTGLVVSDNPPTYYDPGMKTLTVPEGAQKLPDDPLYQISSLEVMDLPRSLVRYSWYSLLHAASLRQIVTDRDAQAAEIALMLDLESVDRDGRKFTFTAPERTGKWIVDEDEENGGLRLLGCKGEIGRVSFARYTTVILPGSIDGRPVTRIGPCAFEGFKSASAFYVPDSVRRIEGRAFGRNQFCIEEMDRLFLRLPEGVIIEEDAFQETRYFVRDKGGDAGRQEDTPVLRVPGPGDRSAAEESADDPANGTGNNFSKALMPNIWQYFDRLSREERVRELTHFFRVNGAIDGVGWATVKIVLDGESARFRISDIGYSPADFRMFAKGIRDGQYASFGWSAEPGSFLWTIQRRGGIFFVTVPVLGKGIFIPRTAFLGGIRRLSDDW